jgi:hypothetical protein
MDHLTIALYITRGHCLILYISRWDRWLDLLGNCLGVHHWLVLQHWGALYRNSEAGYCLTRYSLTGHHLTARLYGRLLIVQAVAII